MNSTSESSAVAVGLMPRSSVDLYKAAHYLHCTNTAVNILHVLGDGLCLIDESTIYSSVEFTEQNFEAADTPIDGESPNGNALMDSNDEKLKRAFLIALKKMGEKPPTPMLTSNFYRNHILQIDNNIDIKKTTYKKFSKFIQEMVQHDYLMIEKKKNGVENIVAINVKHPDVVNAIPNFSDTGGNHQQQLTTGTKLSFVTETNQSYSMQNRNELKTSGEQASIKIRLATRRHDKEVTLIDGMESFGICLSEFANACKSGAAAGASIKRPDSQANEIKGRLMVQGNQVQFVHKLLTKTYKIPAELIDTGLVWTKKEKKEKSKPAIFKLKYDSEFDAEEYDRELEKQQQLKNNISISGCPNLESIDLKSIPTKIFEAFGAEISPFDFASVYRVSNFNSNSPIIVSFVEFKKKLKILGLKAGKTVMMNDVFDGRDVHGNNQLYLNNDVTPYFGRLLAAGRQAKRDELIHACWIGKTGCLVKIHEDGETYNFRSLNDFEELKKFVINNP